MSTDTSTLLHSWQSVCVHVVIYISELTYISIYMNIIGINLFQKDIPRKLQNPHELLEVNQDGFLQLDTVQ